MNRSEATGFFEQIRAHPEDDAPRLVYADWLDEHGDGPRAAFIRVPIERARLPRWDGRQVALRVRESALLTEHGEAWRKELPTLDRVVWGGFRRGFVATAEFHAFSALGWNAKAVWDAAPIELVRVRWPRRDEPTGSIPPVPHLRELSITRRLVDADDMVRLAEAPVLSTLHTLTIDDASIGPDAFRRLCRSPHVKGLRALRVPKNAIGNGGVRVLAETDPMPGLAELDLSERGIYGRYGEDPIVDAEGVAALAAWPGLARLHTLTLNGDDAGLEGLVALLMSPHAVGLKHLGLRENNLDGDALQAFGVARAGLMLETLDVGMNNLQLGGADRLAGAPCLRELKILNVDQCEIGLADIRKLFKAPFMGSLRVLNADFNSMGTKGLSALLKASPPELHTLHLQNNDIANDGVALLTASPASDVLRELDLSYNPFDQSGARALASAPRLTNLLVLKVEGVTFGHAGIKTLKESPLAKRLAALEGLSTGQPTPPPAGAIDEIPF
jgi:uncharacterized protein (TIGR02996 family)